MIKVSEISEKAADNDSYSAQEMIKLGIQTSLPIAFGYIPVALTFGILAKQAGMSILELTMMSAFVYAGASQFMGANMIISSASALEIIVATFVLNFRHFIMSLSFMNQVQSTISPKGRVSLGLGLTDESFAVSALHIDKADYKKGYIFFITVILTAYLTWVIGSLIGGLVGDIIPEQLSNSMGIALYALFIGLLVPSIKRNTKVILIVIIAMTVNYFFSQIMSEGWAIVLGTLIGGLSGVVLLKEENK